MAMHYSTSEVIDLLDVPVDMEDVFEEPCLEVSDDDLVLSLSDDEERLVYTSKLLQHANCFTTLIYVEILMTQRKWK